MTVNDSALLKDMKKYVVLHAKILGVENIVKHLIKNIHELDDSYEDGWGKVFYGAALKYEEKKKYHLALGLYNIAKFPYAVTGCQHIAYQRYLELFSRMYGKKLHKLQSVSGLQQFYINHVRSDNIVILSGGILALKEQWVKLLGVFSRLGLTVVIAEMPAVGENKMRYNADSFCMFSDILDTVDPQKKCRCHLVALSFSGYLALQNSYSDPRIQAITMAGAPIYDLYHNRDAFAGLPYLTKNILAHNVASFLKNPTEKELFDFFDREFPSALKRNDNVDIFYVQSRYDEVILLQEAEHLKGICHSFHKLHLSDVHGSPNYHKVVIFYIIWSVLHVFGQYRVLGFLLKIVRRVFQVFYKYRMIVNGGNNRK